MEFNNPSEIVKDLTFGAPASYRLMQGVEKLSSAVASTLGASLKFVIYQASIGTPLLTTDLVHIT